MNSFELCNVESKRDIDFLYSAFTGDDQFLHSTNLHFNTKQTFESWIRERIGRDFHDFYLVKDKVSDNLIGYVHNYDFSLIDGHCKLSVYIDEKYRKTGIGGFVAVNFLNYLFTEYPLRKVYSTVYDYNHESLTSNLAAGFIEEGIIKEYRYHDGKYYSVHCLSMRRDSFNNTIRKLVK